MGLRSTKIGNIVEPMDLETVHLGTKQGILVDLIRYLTNAAAIAGSTDKRRKLLKHRGGRTEGEILAR